MIIPVINYESVDLFVHLCAQMTVLTVYIFLYGRVYLVSAFNSQCIILHFYVDFSEF